MVELGRKIGVSCKAMMVHVMTDQHPDILIRLRPVASAIPASARLKRLLEFALRSCALRCEDVAEIRPGHGPGNAQDGAGRVSTKGGDP